MCNFSLKTEIVLISSPKSVETLNISDVRIVIFSYEDNCFTHL